MHVYFSLGSNVNSDENAELVGKTGYGIAGAVSELRECVAVVWSTPRLLMVLQQTTCWEPDVQHFSDGEK